MNRRANLVGLAILSGILALSVAWHPHDDGGFVLCLFRNLTGLPCIGCGLTRSFCAMGKGDVVRALGFHWLGPVLFAVVLVYWLRAVVAAAGFAAAVASFDAIVRRSKAAYVVAFALVAVWVVKIAMLGYSGRLVELAREGLLFR